MNKFIPKDVYIDYTVIQNNIQLTRDKLILIYANEHTPTPGMYT